MTTLDAVARKKAEASAEELAAAELVRIAKEQGLSLTGPNGLLKQFTKTVLETALNEEMTEHLGFEPNQAPAERDSANVRNGTRPKICPAKTFAELERPPKHTRRIWMSRTCNASPTAAVNVPAGAQPALLGFTGGNPLALTLAAAVAAESDAVPGDWRPNQETIATLLGRLVGTTPSPAHRRALEICAHSYITSESMLRALMGPQAADLFGWLRIQPFIESTDTGLFPHDVVREALEADLKWRDPQGFAEMHGSLRDFHLQQLRAAPQAQLLARTGALIFLYRADRRMSEFNVFREAGAVQDRPYVPAQRARLLEMVQETEGTASATIAAFWLDRQPEAFRVYHSTHTDELIAFSAWLNSTEPEGADIDPVVAAAWEHARANGPLRGAGASGPGCRAGRRRR